MTKPRFASPGLADSHALKLACANSSTHRAAYVPFTRLLRAEDGSGPAYEACPVAGGSPDYEVVEVSDAEARVRQRAGMRRTADELDEKAGEAEAEVRELRITGKMPSRQVRLLGNAREDREKAARLRAVAAGDELVLDMLTQGAA